MLKVDDYDVIDRSGSSSCFYKVKNKATAEICMWRMINTECLAEHQLKALLKAVNDEKQFNHQNTVQICSHILDDSTKTLYIITKFYKHGNLKSLIELCNKRKEFLSEGFLWRLLYNVVCVLKVKNCCGLLNLENIFLEKDYGVKVHHVDIISRPSNTAKCVYSLGTVLYQLCSLQTETPVIKFPIEVPGHYSEDLFNMITWFLKDPKKIAFNDILCNSDILLKSANQDDVFVRMCIEDVDAAAYQPQSCKCSSYKWQIENLKNKENALKRLEQQLAEKECILKRKEKMLTVMENKAKERLYQAELCLKRAKCNKITNHNTPTCDDLDTTLSAAECDGSIVVPTSTRMNLDGLKPTTAFTRSFSERRIRFKGHSPLKNTCNINRTVTNLEPQVHNKQQIDYNAANAKNRTRVSLRKATKRKSKLLFDVHASNKENHEVQLRADCRPISWTEETKRHAFDMLRVINAAEMAAVQKTLKHTHL